jgi:hypothetical protein
MDRIRPRSFGFAFAAFLGTFHAFWALLVWVGAAQPLLDFVFRLHMIAPAYHVTAFSPLIAAGLIMFTSTVGYVLGWFSGFLWDHFVVGHRTEWHVEHQHPSHAH